MLTLGLFCPAYKALLVLVPSKGRTALPGLAQLLEFWPRHQRVTGLVSGQGYVPGVQVWSLVPAGDNQLMCLTHNDVFFSLSLPLLPHFHYL